MSITINNKEDKVYMILGVPHSATSFVARAFKEAGVHVPSNMVGLYQTGDITKLNDKILKKAGGSWKEPPTEKEIQKVDVKEKIKSIFKKKKKKMWAFKDPRLSLTGKHFLPHMDGDSYLICCFRKPEKVIESYEATEDCVDKKFVDKYNKSIISIIKEFVEL